MVPTIAFLISFGSFGKGPQNPEVKETLGQEEYLRIQFISLSDHLPRPILSADPSPVIPRGADVTLRCQGHLGSNRFQLWKDGELREEKNPSFQQAEFVLRNVDGWNEARSYSCRSGHGPLWSELSEALILVVTGALPKPSISVLPDSIISEGTAVTIRCDISQGAPPWDYSFALLEAKRLMPLQRQSLAGTWANFSLPSVRPEDSGSYSCIYYKDTAPHNGSHPSQTLDLTVLGLLPKPNVWAQLGQVVAPGTNTSLWCSRPKLSFLEEVIFTLWKTGTQDPLQKKTSRDLWTSFSLTSMTPEDTGNYSCTYREISGLARGSKTSDDMELVVTDALPKPSLSVWPASEVISGDNVTLLCQGPSWNVSFVLYKDSYEKTPVSMDNTKDGAKFFLTHMTPKDSGSYNCSYQVVTSGGLWKQYSEPLQLIVTGSEHSNTLIIIFSCVFFLLLCLLLLSIPCWIHPCG
ncbi:immunoglobulin superfamily member 1-like [Notamacropus eugenii]|uniref:immunoglobulin superfamily member 1-like n=1 Tax=Notamacropus eugenii TaxID=9315 RepID=UPI003B677559